MKIYDDQIVRTQLEDLQSEMEAGSRQLNTIADTAGEMRATLVERHLTQVDLAGELIRRIMDLQESIEQQRKTLRELRHAVRQRRRRNE